MPGVVRARGEVRLLLARHGETADNAHGLILGRRDPPLSTTGRAQATRLAAYARNAGLAAVWCSPLRRATQTAAAVAEAVGAGPTVVADLIESDRGDWEGMPVRHIAAVSPVLHAAFEVADPDFAFPHGESLRSQLERTRRALTVVAGGPRPAMVVAHAGTLRAALLAVGRRPPPERLLPHGEALEVLWPESDLALD
jgi:broad specificity phosphatase PhoE